MRYTVLSKLLSEYPLEGSDAFDNFHVNIQTALKELRSFEDPFFVNLDDWGTFLTDIPFLEDDPSSVLGFIADFLDTLITPAEHALIAEVASSITSEDLEEFLSQAEAVQEEGFEAVEIDPEDIISAVAVDPVREERYSPLLRHAPERPNIVNKVSERRALFKEGEPSPPPIHGFTKASPLKSIPKSENLAKTAAVAPKFEVTSSPGVRSTPVVETRKPEFRLTPTQTRSTVSLKKSDLLELLQKMIEEDILSVSLPTIVSSSNRDDATQVDYNFDITDLRENKDGTLSLDFEMNSIATSIPTDVKELSSLWEGAPDVSTEFNTTPTKVDDLDTFGEEVVDPRHNMTSKQLERLWKRDPDLSVPFDSGNN